MTLEEYRIKCYWPITEMARKCGLEYNTLKRALDGGLISVQTAKKIAAALSKELGVRVDLADIEGLNIRL